VRVESLEERIAARLNEALDRQAAGNVYPVGERGLVAQDLIGDLEPGGVILLSVEDVARIAAQEARAWL